MKNIFEYILKEVLKSIRDDGIYKTKIFGIGEKSLHGELTNECVIFTYWDENGIYGIDMCIDKYIFAKVLKTMYYHRIKIEEKNGYLEITKIALNN